MRFHTLLVLATVVVSVMASPASAGDGPVEASPVVRQPMPGRPVLAEAIRAVDLEAIPAQAVRRRDSPLDGLLIGAGIGALAGLIPDHFDDCEECHDALWGSIAVGAGIGLAVDLLRSGRHTVTPPARGRPQLQVAAGKRAVGVRGTYTWR